MNKFTGTITTGVVNFTLPFTNSEALFEAERSMKDDNVYYGQMVI